VDGGETSSGSPLKATRQGSDRPQPTARSRATDASSSAPRRRRPRPSSVRIGVISDTHGYLDPRVLALFAGVDHIIHAGDVVDPRILSALEAVAPLTAVSGNIDSGDLAERLPREVSGEIAGVRFVVGHKQKRLMKRLAAGKLAPGAGGQAPDLVIYGHDHVPTASWIEGTLYLNPGTASSLEEEDDDPTVAIVERGPTGLAVRFVPLQRQPQGDEIS
jgi:putative phosphoesterase